MHVFPNPVTYRIFFIVLRIKHGMYIMKQKDLEKEIVDEQLDEQGVDEEQCDNVSSEKAKRKRKRKQLKVYYVYILSSFK